MREIGFGILLMIAGASLMIYGFSQIRKRNRQRKIDQIRSVVQCCDEYEGRRA